MLALAAFGAAVPLACGGGSAAPVDEARSSKLRVTDPAVSPDDAAELARDNLALAVDLHLRIRASEPGNFVFSQPSISIALAMLYAGAGTNTAAQMAQALHFSLPPERLHPAFDALDLALTAPPASGDAGAFRLTVANSLWTQKGFALQPTYLDTLAEDYGAGMYIQDFAGNPEAARHTINGWVSDQTEHQIPELFAQGTIDPSTRLVLTDAIFFHGDWKNPFEPQSPSGTFHAPTGDVSVPMMRAEFNGQIWSGTGFSAATLPYVGGTTSMIIVVPDAGTFDAFEGSLTADSLAALLSPAATGVGNVVMPRFKFGSTPAIADILKALGMTDAFDPAAADLSGIDGARDLFVQAIVHKAIIAVDEQGTTASAATGIGVGTTAAPTNILVADRPFLFFVRHDPTGAILFQGRVVDPSAN
jgi:serpin B